MPARGGRRADATLTVHGRAENFDTMTAERLGQLRAECRARFPAPAREHRYSVIYVDPPWDYDRRSQQQQGAVPYPSLTLEELQALPVPAIAAPNCAMFLWTTSPKLPTALKLLEAWGFEFKSVFRCWRKVYADGRTCVGLGYWSQVCFEFLLVATRGDGFLKHRGRNESQELAAPVAKRHSAKPPGAREAIERLNIPGKKVELFARQRAPGWDAWGLEVDGFFQAADQAAEREADA